MHQGASLSLCKVSASLVRETLARLSQIDSRSFVFRSLWEAEDWVSVRAVLRGVMERTWVLFIGALVVTRPRSQTNVLQRCLDIRAHMNVAKTTTLRCMVLLLVLAGCGRFLASFNLYE